MSQVERDEDFEDLANSARALAGLPLIEIEPHIPEANGNYVALAESVSSEDSPPERL